MKSSNTLLGLAIRLFAMEEESINHVFATNLRALMAREQMTQSVLAQKSGVVQKTISNYLNPKQRALGAKGKEPSAKLTELDLVAKALNVEPWQLLRPIDPMKRALHDRVEALYLEFTKPLQATPVTPKYKKPAQEADRFKAA